MRFLEKGQKIMKTNHSIHLVIFLVSNFTTMILCSATFIQVKSIPSSNKTQNIDSEKYILRARENCGFFSEFLGAIQNISWCDQEGKKAVIYWDNKSLYYEPNGFNNSHNAWEYYFEPISDAKYEPGNKINRVYETPSGFGIPYKDYSHMEELRSKMHAVIKKHIKIKPYVLDVVNNFYNKNMKNCIVIGIHLRGTDKKFEAKPINPLAVINKAKEYAQSAKKIATQKQIKFLVASDEQRLINFAKKNLNGNVIVYAQAMRSADGKPVHYTHANNKVEKGYFANLGRDVLVEALLLAQCDFFVHTRSNVSTAVILFNPNLIHFQYDGYANLD